MVQGAGFAEGSGFWGSGFWVPGRRFSISVVIYCVFLPGGFAPSMRKWRNWQTR